MKYSDIIKGIKPNAFFASENILLDYNIKDIQNIMEEFSLKYEKIVPFTSKTGVFGYNTWLYLYFNGLFPVAVSPNPYAVHNGIFKGSISTMCHDISHFNTQSKYNKEYIDLIANIYKKMFKMNLEDGILEGYIIFLYEYLHERSHVIDCANIQIEYGTSDYSIQKVMLKTSFFTPERYGFNTKNIEQFINHKNFGPSASYLIEATKYGKEMFSDIYKMFCNQFKQFIHYDNK